MGNDTGVMPTVRRRVARACLGNQFADLRASLFLGVFLLNALAAVGCALAADGAKVEKVDEQRIAYREWRPGERVYRAYFDAENRLRWDDNLVHRTATGECDTQPPMDNSNRLPRRVLLGKPRVDKRSCLYGDNDGEETVLGLDETGKLLWQRKIGRDRRQPPATGPQSHNEDIIGADESSLVTNTLEVWSPSTGAILVPAVGDKEHPGGWKIPRYGFHSGAWFRPLQRDFIVVVKDEPRRDLGPPGVHRLDPVSGGHEQLIAERSCGTLWIFAKLYVMDLRVDPTGRYLAMHRECQGRGYSPWSDFAVFDMQSRRLVHEERFDAQTTSIASLTMADDGDIGLALHDHGLSQLRLIRYRPSRR